MNETKHNTHFDVHDIAVNVGLGNGEARADGFQRPHTQLKNTVQNVQNCWTITQVAECERRYTGNQETNEIYPKP